jgi:hypothetical protein
MQNIIFGWALGIITLLLGIGVKYWLDLKTQDKKEAKEGRTYRRQLITELKINEKNARMVLDKSTEDREAFSTIAVIEARLKYSRAAYDGLAFMSNKLYCALPEDKCDQMIDALHDAYSLMQIDTTMIQWLSKQMDADAERKDLNLAKEGLSLISDHVEKTVSSISGAIVDLERINDLTQS